MRCWLPITFFGEDFLAIVDYIVTVPYHAGTFYDPPDGPEVEVHDIWLAQDFPGSTGPEFATTGALFDHLTNTLDERICEHARDNYEPDYYPYD
jgi:hypothetical protein